jgi:hypothetical protein
LADVIRFRLTLRAQSQAKREGRSKASVTPFPLIHTQRLARVAERLRSMRSSTLASEYLLHVLQRLHEELLKLGVAENVAEDEVVRFGLAAKAAAWPHRYKRPSEGGAA